MKLIILRIGTKEKMIVMINDCISLNFLGKRCKDIYHKSCDGQWKRLGFTIFFS